VRTAVPRNKQSSAKLGSRGEKGVTAPPAPYILRCGICGDSVRLDLWLDIHACDTWGARETEKRWQALGTAPQL
jgi:hypothetical protein